MEISINEIHRYLECPSKYRIEFKDGLDYEKEKSVLFREAVHKTISYFFYTAMTGYIPTMAQMKDKWANTWEESSKQNDIIQELLSVRLSLAKKSKGHRDPEMDKYRMQGFEMIYNFYNKNKNNPGTVIAVDTPYRVAIDGVAITGEFELIREIVDDTDGKRYIEIVDFKTSDNTDLFLVKNDFNLTLASYAFRELFGAVEDRNKYYYLKSGKEMVLSRGEADYARMKAIVNGVRQGIESEMFYPRQSFMCKSCPVQDICDRIQY